MVEYIRHEPNLPEAIKDARTKMEYERVRGGIREGIRYFHRRFGELSEAKYKKQGNPDFMDTTDIYEQAISETIVRILSLVEIKADDQSLPENPHSPMTDGKFGTFGEGQESLLKPDLEGNHWIRVTPKRK